MAMFKPLKSTEYFPVRALSFAEGVEFLDAAGAVMKE